MIILVLSFVIALTGMFFLFLENFKLNKTIHQLKLRNPTEIDLELATYDQIMAELRKRPIRYLFILPQFKMDEGEGSIELASVAVEASGLPPDVAQDIIHAACGIVGNSPGEQFNN